jgi:(R,R)-butanediol dehydrogenase / meso-butanediol dehydrogenase / diacetyl reductase
MKACVLHGVRDLRYEATSPDPAPVAGEVLVRVARTGLCGSDLHVFRTGDFIASYPVVPGHEVVGTVVGEGPGTHGFLGRRVALDSRVPCGWCPWCAQARYQRCEAIGFLGEVRGGGFGELIAVPVSRIYPMPDDLGFETAVLAEPTAVVLHAWSRAMRAVEGHRGASLDAVVLGAGPVGVLTALAAPDDINLVLVEPNPARAELARRLTYRDVLDADRLEHLANGFDLAFDCAGAEGSIGKLASLIRPGGVVTAVALHHAPDALDVNLLVGREVTVTGTHVFDDEMPEALALLAARGPAFAPVVDRVVGLAELPALVEAAADGRADHLKLAVDPTV